VSPHRREGVGRECDKNHKTQGRAQAFVAAKGQNLWAAGGTIPSVNMALKGEKGSAKVPQKSYSSRYALSSSKNQTTSRDGAIPTKSLGGGKGWEGEEKLTKVDG